MKFHTILDEFSFQCFKPEGAIAIPSNKPLDANLITRDSPQFFLFESVWCHWQGGNTQVAQKWLQTNLVHYRKANIPIVFWNKEDPCDTGKFHLLAKLADIVLTTDSNSIQKYTNSGCPCVSCMMFAAQPLLHKPYAQSQTLDVVFAGAFYTRHKDRMDAYDYILKPLLPRIDIYARNMKHWPQECHKRIISSLPYNELLPVVSKYKIAINWSSIKSSPTMFPRRVVELPLSNVLVVSDDCMSVKRNFPHIPIATSAKETLDIVNYYLNHEQERVGLVEKIKEGILDRFLCSHQLQTILTLCEGLS